MFDFNEIPQWGCIVRHALMQPVVAALRAYQVAVEKMTDDLARIAPVRLIVVGGSAVSGEPTGDDEGVCGAHRELE